MNQPITILGGGCTGPLLATMLAKRGHAVRIFERRPDGRRVPLPAGRSINLALAARGLSALDRAGLMNAVRPMLVPMRGRMVHDLGGGRRFLPYGQRPHEVIWSVARADLNRVLVDAAELNGVDVQFEHAAVAADFEGRQVTIEDLRTGRRFDAAMDPVIGADGANSVLREEMVRAGHASAREEPLAHQYKELTIPADRNGTHQLDHDALHIWPRGGHMLIALPNADGTFTVTLFLAARDAAVSFASLDSPRAVRQLFNREFADVLRLIPDLEAQFEAHPIGRLSTIYAEPWHVGGGALLIGDAAHAIVPFHGQGMNCAFEDCQVLDDLVGSGAGWEQIFGLFDVQRRANTDAIARMALENYVEMRDTVRDPRFALQKELSLELERREPQRFIPRYSMVMFHDEIGYAEAERRGSIQSILLDEATRGRQSVDQIDFQALEAAIRERLPPVSTPAARA